MKTLKTLHDIARSRDFREKTLNELEMIPESILKHNRNDRPTDPVVGNKTQRVAKRILHTIDPTQIKHFDLFRTSGTGCRGKGGVLSTFSQNICRFLVKFYTEVGDTVYDPFAGHNSRMEAVFKCNRNYYGSDISEDFMEYNYEIRDFLLGEKGLKGQGLMDGSLFNELSKEDQKECNINAPEIVLRTGDSRKVPWPDEFANFTVTSPPYWDLEWYGDEPEQLGYGPKGSMGYEEFLKGIEEVLGENYRVLKPGAFCAWNVNDFRKGGKFYDYHTDIILIGKKIGFILHDMIIFDLGQPVAAAFITQMVSRKVMAKRHEYCMIFRKPGGEPLTSLHTKEDWDEFREEYTETINTEKEK